MLPHHSAVMLKSSVRPRVAPQNVLTYNTWRIIGEKTYQPLRMHSPGLSVFCSYMQCCGSRSGRIRTFLPDPEISPPNPDPDPALVVVKKISVSVQYRAYVYLFTT